ncbi:MAG: hypothetical protein V4556_02410 [Bacteroidota bacterium]
MAKAILVYIFILLFSFEGLYAQTDTPFYKGALKENREKHYRNLIDRTITKNLSLAPNEENESLWEDAFWAIELIQYRSPSLKPKIKIAFDSAQRRSHSFQRSLLELVYAMYPKEYAKEVSAFLQSDSAKIFAMAAEFLSAFPEYKKKLPAIVRTKFKNNLSHPIIKSLLYNLEGKKIFPDKKSLAELFNKKYLKGYTILYSIQRKNRNYPGLAIVKDANGNFVKDKNGKIFNVPQLARSINNLPGYLSKGNTPQGIFSIDSFDISRSMFIGPTTNVQLTMPNETSVQHFFKDSTLTDTIWTEALFKKILPASMKNYFPIFGTYYAGAAGRTEIIAHGTTVNPEYYKGQPYYPHTPTEGCLATKEIWNGLTGKLEITNQQKLADAVAAAGGANGYCIVIEIDDQQKSVSLTDILYLLQ